MSDFSGMRHSFLREEFTTTATVLSTILPMGFTLTAEISYGNQSLKMQVVAAPSIVTISKEDAA